MVIINMKFINKHKKIIISSIAIIIFMLVVRRVFTEQITFYDKIAQDIVNNIRCDLLTVIMKTITFMCSITVLLAICLLTFLLGDDKKKASLISVNLILVFLINTLIKWIVQRPRPDEILRLIEESGFSFPSGHSMISMAFYGYITYLVYKHVKDKKKRIIYCLLLLLLIALIGISRIYLGVHYLSDVLGGFAFSVAYLMLFITFSPKILDLLKGNKNGKEKKNKI